MKMKVTKKTERISKTEQSTKTYQVTGNDEDKKHQFITGGFFQEGYKSIAL